jgi:hypothetical protein
MMRIETLPSLWLKTPACSSTNGIKAALDQPRCVWETSGSEGVIGLPYQVKSARRRQIFAQLRRHELAAGDGDGKSVA